MRKQFTTDEFNGLNQIAAATKMDCWFSIQEKEDEDIIWDLENNKALSWEEGLSQLAEGIVDSLSDYKLSQDEIAAVEALFTEILEV